MIVWFTGPPGAGKTTLTAAVARRLGCPVIDGDGFRARFGNDLGFSPEDRRANLLRAVTVARYLTAPQDVILCAFVSPYLSSRAEVRAAAGDGFRLVEVYAPLDVCEERDPKGLYARARRGEIPEFTGVSAPYDRPTDADLIVDTRCSLDACVHDVCAWLARQV